MAGAGKRYDIIIEHHTVYKTYKVKVTYVSDPHNFFVRPAGCADLKVLEKRERRAKLYDISLGTPVVFFAKTVNKYVRGEVVAIFHEPNEKYAVRAIDYGFTEDVVELRHIYMPKYQLNVPSLAIPCKLANCQPSSLTFCHEIIEAMNNYVEDEICSMRVVGFESGKVVVELRINENDDIGKILSARLYTSLGLAGPALRLAMSNNPIVSMKILNKGAIVNIRVLRSKKLFANTYYVSLFEDYKKYLKDRQEFSDFCRYEGPMTKEKIRVTKIVGHKGPLDMHYERAVVTNVLEDGTRAAIQKIDTGEADEVMVEDLKEVNSMQLFIKPGIALLCTFFESKEDQKRIPSNMLPGYETWIKLIDTGIWNIAEIVPKPE